MEPPLQMGYASPQLCLFSNNLSLVVLQKGFHDVFPLGSYGTCVIRVACGHSWDPSPTSMLSPHRPKPGFFNLGVSQSPFRVFTPLFFLSHTSSDQETRQRPLDTQTYGAFKCSPQLDGRSCYEVSRQRPPCSCTLSLPLHPRLPGTLARPLHVCCSH